MPDLHTLFIADLHLDPAHPASLNRFHQLLNSNPRHLDALYILGDLFEVWIGDDALTSELSPTLPLIKQFTQNIAPIFLIHGNRDFLLGEDFATKTGIRYLPEEHIIDLYGQKALLMHGDTLCTDDNDYQAFRCKVRNPEWQTGFLALSIADRQHMANEARTVSKQLNREKPADILDVNQQATIRTMEKHHSCLLIHGHTHRPAVHQMSIHGKPGRRFVLGAWHATATIVKASKNKIILLDI